ncbi:MAG: glycosyl transferase (group I) [Deltaproteobacteria bacterium]|nr:MAG: glycosyl transferase (group I) [Deltaproteobacteria bacterium]
MKNILFLAHRIPYPPNKGDKIRSFNEIKYLSKYYNIDLICFADDYNDLKYKKDLRKYCRNIVVVKLEKKAALLRGALSFIFNKSISEGYFYKKTIQKIFESFLSRNNYEEIFCFSSVMASCIFKSKVKNIYLSMDYCDLDSDKWLQYSKTAKFPLSLIFKTEAKRLLNFEKKINRFFDRSIFVSEKEALLFKTRYPEAKNISVISNGVDTNFFSPSDNKMKNDFPVIGFFGAMDYYANVNSVLWFYENVFPLIQKEVPDCIFYIVGSNPDKKVKELEKDLSVKVTGFVEDIRPYYEMTDVCVVPIQIARGVQNKVLEAMAMGKAVVSTSMALQGLKELTFKELIVEDKAKNFGEKVLSLLERKNESFELGVKARDFVKKYYSWDSNLSVLLNRAQNI